jgi:hypothetical protein
MTGTKQQSEHEVLCAATHIMIRALILAAVVAFVVSAALGSVNGGWRKAPTPLSIGAADDVSQLSLRNAPPKPPGFFLDNPASGGF